MSGKISSEAYQHIEIGQYVIIAPFLLNADMMYSEFRACVSLYSPANPSQSYAAVFGFGPY